MKKLQPLIWQFVRFGCVGALNTAVDYAVYALTILVLGEEYYTLGHALGFFAGTLNAFLLNSRLVFEKKRSLRQLLRTYAGYGLTFALSLGLLMMWVELLDVNRFLAKILNLCVTVPLNFVINRLWIFKK